MLSAAAKDSAGRQERQLSEFPVEESAQRTQSGWHEQGGGQVQDTDAGGLYGGALVSCQLG